MIEITRVAYDGMVTYTENGEQHKMTKDMARRRLYNSKISDYPSYIDFEKDNLKFIDIINAKERHDKP